MFQSIYSDVLECFTNNWLVEKEMMKEKILGWVIREIRVKDRELNAFYNDKEQLKIRD